MSETALTPERVLELKADATHLKQERGIKHAAALQIVAQGEGFRTWEDLLAAAGGGDAVRDAKHDREPTETSMRRAERRRRFVGDAS